MCSGTSVKQIRPLEGIKVIELEGYAPVPHCGLMLSDFGAKVTVISKGEKAPLIGQRLTRGKEFLVLNLKTKEGLKKARDLILESDVLLDPYRPGVLEKLDLDPVQLLQENKKLVVARLTGYGQTGDLAKTAGHDINYVAMSGLLPVMTAKTDPRPPYWPSANMIADLAGGGLTAAFGVVAALYNRCTNGGQGAIIDASIVEGIAYLGTFLTMHSTTDTLFTDKHAILSGNCPIYRTYETSDGKHLAVAPLEPRFTETVFKILGVKWRIEDITERPEEVKKDLEQVFKQKSQKEWLKLMEGKDTCVTPVLDMEETADVEHFKQREAYRLEEGKWVPQPAPRIYSSQQFAAFLQSNKAGK